jgi:hypothetical protein
MLTQLSAQDSTRVEAQPGKTSSSKQDIGQRVYYGGNVSLTVGNYTRIGLYPLVGYKITPKLSAGVQVGYEYIRDNRYSSTYETSNYWASVFTRYRIIPQLYAHVEYAQLNYELYNGLGESSRQWVPFLLVGGGYSQPIGPRTWLNLQVLFDVLQHERSPYSRWSPIFSVGVGVGF